MRAPVQFMHFLLQAPHRWQQTYSPRGHPISSRLLKAIKQVFSKQETIHENQGRATAFASPLRQHTWTQLLMCLMAKTPPPRSTMMHIQRPANISVLDRVLRKHAVEQLNRRNFLTWINNQRNKMNQENMYKVLNVSWVKFYFRESSILQAKVC